MRLGVAFAFLATALAGSPVSAQPWEASALIGLTPSAGLERQATELSDVDLRGGVTWGFQAARFFSPSFGAEVMWTRQGSALEIGTNAGKADLFSVEDDHTGLSRATLAAVIWVQRAVAHPS